jgi:hypothetical protein
MTTEFQPATCVLCNKPGEHRDIGNFEKEYRCSQKHHYIVTFGAETLLAGSGNNMADPRKQCIEKLVPPGKILFIRTASTKEKETDPSLGLVAETRAYRG